ncbi:MATE family efflux transporter [Balneatrix alpica]|uniref:Multidrug-efflux transporter n=1 Tax=Balneatrix alpica TaxID=75684 RepID=A0ABV5Z702_9GAMM|nr:MATE family efflux transporter [Balneatrix alpica]
MTAVAVSEVLPPRRQELKELLLLALPIIAGQVAQTGMAFVDTLMAGAVSPQDLAAVALGSSIWVPLFLLIIGTLMATTPNVAQLFGAERHGDIAPLVRQALWLGLGLGCLGSLFLLQAEPVLAYFIEQDAALREQTQIYLNGVAMGFPAIACYQVLRYYSDGMGKTRPAMYVAFIGLAANIPLNYLFIYGFGPIPALGGAGCGWASGIVMWIMCLSLAGYLDRSRFYRHFRLLHDWQRPQWSVIWDLIKLGIPIGLAIFMEASMFSIIALLLAPLGATVVSGHQIALNFSSVTFMVPLSIAMAITIRVGQALGAGKPQLARFRALSGIQLNLLFACLSFSLMRFMPETLAGFYSTDGGVILVAAELLMLAGLFQFSDAMQVSVAGVLRGYKDTRTPMLLVAVAYWGIGLPLGWQLALGDSLPWAPMGAPGFWIALISGLTVAALLLFVRMQRISYAAIRHHQSAA